MLSAMMNKLINSFFLFFFFFFSMTALLQLGVYGKFHVLYSGTIMSAEIFILLQRVEFCFLHIK